MSRRYVHALRGEQAKRDERLDEIEKAPVKREAIRQCNRLRKALAPDGRSESNSHRMIDTTRRLRGPAMSNIRIGVERRMRRLIRNVRRKRR